VRSPADARRDTEENMQSIYVMATGQHVGKTTISMGLISLLASRGLRVHFLKPVGQQYVEWNHKRVDKDVVLMQSAMSLNQKPDEMSPVTIPRGFVEKYLFERDHETMLNRLLDTHRRLAENCDVLVIEGTGHAGVGACLDLSGADVAALLGAKVIVVAEGGIGSTLDQVALNVGLLRLRNVDVLGVIVNKVLPEKLSRVEHALRQGLENMGLQLIAAIPYDAPLTYPRVGQLMKTLDARVLCGEAALGSIVENVLVAAMEPQNVVPHLKPRTLVITPGDRVDNILVSLNSRLFQRDDRASVVGLVLTGGLLPHVTIMAMTKNSGLPVLVCKEDTYSVSAAVFRTVVKIMPEDSDKIERVRQLARKYLNVDHLLQHVIGGENAPAPRS
jgi:dethiobiotin synthase